MKKLLIFTLLLALFIPSPMIVFAQEENSGEAEKCDATEEQQRAHVDTDTVYFDCEVPPEPVAAPSSSPSGPLAGCSNAQKVWNFLKGKGMSDIQAAGSMGNLQHEGGFNPKRVEDGWGYPAEMDTIPPNDGPDGQPGYGIVQWTSPGRKAALQNLSNQRKASGTPNSEVYSLELQLDHMWNELSGPYKDRALDPLMQATDLAQAVRIWQNEYEVGSNFQPRMDAAVDWLNRATTGNWCG